MIKLAKICLDRMALTKTELIQKYSSIIVEEMVAFTKDFTGLTTEDLDLDPHRDFPVFKIEVQKYLKKFVAELEENG